MLSGKLKKTACKGMAGLLTAAMCATLIPCVTGGTKVSADVIKNQDDTYMGVSPITNPKKPENIDSEWSGSYVYFGKYNMFPIRFRVLDKDSTAQTENESLFLDSDICLFKREYTDNSIDATWENSTLRTYLNTEFFETAFTGREQNAIVTSVYAGGEHYAEGTYEDTYFKETAPLNDKIFILDFADVLNEDYGYYPDSGWEQDKYGFFYYHHVPNHIKTNFYWLRTHSKRNGGMPGAVYDGGALDISNHSNPYTAVAPALCVDHESILFSSRVNPEFAEAENEFRLTLIDDDMEIEITDGQYVLLDEGGAVKVPYTISGDDAECVSRVSVLILDREYKSGNTNNANIIYYDDIGGDFGDNGTGLFELPEQLDMANWGKTYHVYIVAEEVNGWKHTDYASEPVEVYAPCNGWTLIDGEYYYYDLGECEFITGWYKEQKEDIVWYYLEPVTKTMVRGWKFIDGFWYYFKNSGEMATNWLKIDGFWYYFGSNGQMRTNWQEIDGIWYYFGTNGSMRTGWQRISGKWYYFSDSGAMLTGWLQDDGIWYYFGEDGAMVTGWNKISDVWYYFGNSGAMVTGWNKIGEYYYYFKASGAMAAGEYCNGYWLNPGGEWTYRPIAEWKSDSKGTYFEDTSGWYAKNQTLIIDGVAYSFDASGYLIET